MNRQYHKWWSPHLNRDMELLVFGHAGAKVLVFPTRGGRFYEYENLRMVAQIDDKLAQGQLQLFCVDSLDTESFYCFWAQPAGRISRHAQYENYVLKEVLPFIHDTNPHPCLISHGCSLGGYHAANIAFRHPHLFNKLCVFSGRFDLTMQVECFADLLEGYYNDTVYFHTPSHFLPNLHCPNAIAHLQKMDIVIVIGEQDPFLANNQHMSQVLDRKDIKHQLHTWQERAHQGHYWRKMVREYL